jgi:hypothetical protein
MKVSNLTAVAAALATTFAVSAPLAAHAAPQAGEPRHCFYANQWHGWTSPSPNVLYLRVNIKEVYRVDLLGSGSRLNAPGAFLISTPYGSSTVCSALDLNLAVSDTQGFSTPLFPKSLTLLTPEEVLALPKSARP